MGEARRPDRSSGVGADLVPSRTGLIIVPAGSRGGRPVRASTSPMNPSSEIEEPVRSMRARNGKTSPAKSMYINPMTSREWRARLKQMSTDARRSLIPVATLGTGPRPQSETRRRCPRKGAGNERDPPPRIVPGSRQPDRQRTKLGSSVANRPRAPSVGERSSTRPSANQDRLERATIGRIAHSTRHYVGDRRSPHRKRLT
jgi:hypothetical protein